MLRGLTGSSRFWFVAFLMWAFTPLLPALLGLVLAFSWAPTTPAVASALLCAGGALLSALGATLYAIRRPRGWAMAGWGAAGGLLATQAPAIVRVLLPWEEPGTGEGSPLAVLISVVAFGGFFGVFFTLPGVICASWVWFCAQARSGSPIPNGHDAILSAS